MGVVIMGKVIVCGALACACVYLVVAFGPIDAPAGLEGYEYNGQPVEWLGWSAQNAHASLKGMVR